MSGALSVQLTSLFPALLCYTLSLILFLIQSTPLEFSITLSNCQPGYELREVNNIFTCQCTDNDFYIRNCEEDVIVLQNGLWAGMEVEPYPHLDTTVCPAPYCRCHTRSSEQQSCESLYYQDNSEAGQQCHPTRTGKGFVQVGGDTLATYSTSIFHLNVSVNHVIK